MILPDANLLLYAHNQAAAQHDAARLWLEETLNTSELVGLTWASILAFLRLSTNARVFPQPYSPSEAVEIVAPWLERPTVRLLNPGEGHWEILARLVVQAQSRADLVSDAHLAALALEHGATLCSTDRDFTRFPGLRFVNPLEQR